MIGLERTGWGNRLTAKSSRSGDEATAIVRLRKPMDSQPTAPIAQKLVLAVAQVGGVPVESLVKMIAAELYEEELRNGAAVLDIGLFGSRLFHQEVFRELHAGNGIFWDIEKPEDH